MRLQIGIVGAGNIGADLAYAFAGKVAKDGGSVVLYDIASVQVARAMVHIGDYARKAVKRGKMSQGAADRLMAAIKPTDTRMSDLADCDLVIEAVKEDLDVKRQVLRGIEAVVSPGCLIGSTTSGLRLAWLTEGMQHPERCFVTHPFFPAWRSLPMELVSSGDEQLTRKMYEMLVALGKVPIMVKDVVCFAGDDLFCNMGAEAMRIVQERIANPYQIDRIVNERLGGGGPFLAHDLTHGNMLTASCLMLMQKAHDGNPCFAPPILLLDQRDKPWLDRKNPGSSDYDEATAKIVMDRILAVLLGRAYAIVDEGVCSASDLDLLSRLAFGFKKGLPTVHPPETYHFLRDVTVDTRRVGDIAIVTVRRPEVMNALSKQTIRELVEAFMKLEFDDRIKGIILTGFDGTLAGADVNELAALETAEACMLHAAPGQDLTLMIEGLGKPVVAVCNGFTLGGGSELAMACHARIVGPKAVIGQPEVNLGVIPGYGGTMRLPRIIGLERALHMLRTGESINAAQAIEYGWATGPIVEDPIEAAIALLRRHIAGEITLKPLSHEPMDLPGTIDMSGINIGHHSSMIDNILCLTVADGLKLRLPEGLKREAAGFGQCKGTKDMEIGLRNFTENGPKVRAEFVHA